MRKDLITNWLAKKNLYLTEAQLNQLALYQDMVLTAPINLTAIKTNEDFAIKHFIDSFTLLEYIDKCKKNIQYIDIGTGAGFPGIPLKIARPEIKLTLLDSLQKRILFLRRAVDALSLSDVECVHARIEDSKVKKYDVAFCRAVARLDKLLMYAIPILNPGGVFFAMKGPDISDEIKNAKPILDKFGVTIESIDKIEIAHNMKHTIIQIRKQMNTDSKG